MNGFSVCNKLKKDPSLKDVPLIIMSSESSDETFDQHKKLRTRAEDYVHKPIAFGELLEHIRQFVQVGAPPSEAEGAIVIDDEIEVGSADYLLEEDGQSPAEDAALPASGGGRLEAVDDDVNAFAESAFGRLTGPESAAPAVETPHFVRNGVTPSEPSGASQSVRGSVAPSSVRPGSLRPPSGLDVLEHERVKGELAAARERLETVERELDDAIREMGKLRLEVGDSAQLMRELDELRTKVAAVPKAGATSSREFLDLREALNKKDKEILAFREQLSRKDRDIVEAQDRALGLERSRADVEERLLGVERELAESRDKGELLTDERDVARKANEELRSRLERLKAEADGKDRQITELRARQADERTATEAKLAAVRAEADQVIANERAEHARSLDHAEQRRGADLEQARRDRDGALAEARQQSDRERQEALGAQFAQLRQEHETALSALRRGHLQELERARGEALLREQASLEALRSQHGEEIRSVVEDRDARIAATEAKASQERTEVLDHIAEVEAELSALRGEHRSLTETKRADDEAYAALSADLEQRLTSTESGRDELQRHLAAATDRVAALVAEMEIVRRDLGETNERLTVETTRTRQAQLKADGDRQSLERAKDALAVALAQIEATEPESAS